MSEDDISPLEPLIRLNEDDQLAYMVDDRTVALSVHRRGNSRYWIKLNVFDFPNDLARIDDLKRHGVYLSYLAAIRKFVIT